MGDVLTTGFWAARISEITEEDTVLIIGGGPTGICTLLCVMLRKPEKILLCEQDEDERRFIKEHYPEVIILSPEQIREAVKRKAAMEGPMWFWR